MPTHDRPQGHGQLAINVGEKTKYFLEGSCGRFTPSMPSSRVRSAFGIDGASYVHEMLSTTGVVSVGITDDQVSVTFNSEASNDDIERLERLLASFVAVEALDKIAAAA